MSDTPGTDPLDVLADRLGPVDPSPEFAARLRARVERTLALPPGVTVSDLPDPGTPSAPTPDDRPTPGRVVPYLAVAGASAAIPFYRAAFGARLVGEPIVMPDGRIGHAELDLGEGASLMLSDEHPEIGVVAPSPQGASVTLYLNVRDVDEALARAVAAGATLDRPAADYDYGRNGVVVDPFGHRWMLAGPVSQGGLRHGDVGYVSLWTPDTERAAAFYAAVLGWRYAEAHGGRSRQVVGQSLHHGLWTSTGHPTLFVCFAVADLEAALDAVQQAGGHAGPVESEPFGRVSTCADDQGVRFAVFEPPGGVSTLGRADRPRHGDVAYLTCEVVDSARARRFYGAVLGWQFQPGRVEDGWQVDGVVPMTGLRGGCEVATTVPMYAVDDIETAVAAVRAAGGTAEEPEQQPYGRTAGCVDDQGTRFSLGQL